MERLWASVEGPVCKHGGMTASPGKFEVRSKFFCLCVWRCGGDRLLIRAACSSLTGRGWGGSEVAFASAALCARSRASEVCTKCGREKKPQCMAFPNLETLRLSPGDPTALCSSVAK